MACKLCFKRPLATNQPSMGYGTLLPSFRPPGWDEKDRIRLTVAEVISQHFWFETNGDSHTDSFVCQSCWTKVLDFHRFYEDVQLQYEACMLIWPKFKHSHLKAPVPRPFSADLSGSDDWDRIDERREEQEDDDDHKESPDNYANPTRKERMQKTVAVKIEANEYEEEEQEDAGDAAAAAHSSNTTPNPLDNADQKLFEEHFRLECDLCSEPLRSLLDARAHYQRAHKQRGYLTCGCGKRFTRDTAIREHCKFHVDPSPHKCTECCRIFSNAAWLASHNRCKHSGEAPAPPPDRHHHAETRKLPHCKVLQRRNDELLRRYMSMVCDLCGDAFDTFEEAVQHHQLQHGDDAGYVVCCGKKYKKKPRAVLHCHWHENPRQFDCKECGRNFTGVECLRRHIGDHHPSAELPFLHPCDECERSFQQPSQLRNHKRLKHTPKDAMRYECYVCHKRYRCLSYLRYHLRDVHYSTGPSHVCDVCAKSFQSKNSYELHYAVEHGTESLRRQCAECGKWLKHARCLKSHIKLNHSDGGPPVACDQCAYVARNARALYSHRRFTHCEPAYKCLVCDKRFKTKTVLREHSAIHTGITDLYTCSYCPQTFRSGANMYKHRREKHAAQWELDKRMAHSIQDEPTGAQRM